MLILKRKVGESIVIQAGGALIRVTVVYRKTDGTGIGIEAPSEIRVDREEIYELRRRANADAR